MGFIVTATLHVGQEYGGLGVLRIVRFGGAWGRGQLALNFPRIAINSSHWTSCASLGQTYVLHSPLGVIISW